MQLFEQPIQIDSKWIPRSSSDLAEKYHYSLKLKAGEKKIWRKSRPILPSKWNEQNRMVTMSPIPGKWSNSVTPYLTDIMDASFFESVENINICAAHQVGKSECVNNCMGYCVDRRPGSFLVGYPDELTARDNSKDRIADMIRTSSRLREHLTGYDDDISFYRINFKHMQIYMGWARSISRMVNKPLPYAVFDEVDLYPDVVGKQKADPINEGENRTRTYNEYRKIWKTSSPTIEEGRIWQILLNETQIVFDYWAKCPDCDLIHLMVFNEDCFKIPENERDPQKIKAEKLGWYECPGCRSKWNDAKRDEAVRLGKWLASGGPMVEKSREETMNADQWVWIWDYLKIHRPISIGFHMPSWLSHFVFLSAIMARFIKGTKNKAALRHHMNTDRALPWKIYEQERKEDQILALRDDRPRGMVPGGGIVACLTAAVDTQDDGFYYEIRAWGYGMEKESWCIREGFVTEFDALVQVLWQDQYEDGEGNPYLVRLVLQDAMGHRTSEVYDFCRLHRGKILPIKGEQRMNQPFTYTNLEYYPGKSRNKPIPGGLKLVRVNTNYYKNDLSSILEIPPADPGAWHYHRETTEDWARQMTAEYIDEKGLWQLMASRANHAWDVSVYNLCAHDVLGVKFWPKGQGSGFTVQGSGVGRKARSKGIEGERWIRDYERPGWLKDR